VAGSFHLARDGQCAVAAYKEAVLQRVADNRQLDIGAQQAFDIVLMDCQMPRMDGFLATHYIRVFEKEHDLPRVPILALTAGHEHEKCLACGMDAVMRKPVSRDSLLQKIQLLVQEAIGKHPQQAAPLHPSAHAATFSSLKIRESIQTGRSGSIYQHTRVARTRQD
jgi:CheY-like chemotaxis protein